MHIPSGERSVTLVPSGGWGRSGGSVPYTLLGCSVTHVPVGDGVGQEELCHVPSGGRSETLVPSEGWGRTRLSVACTQWGTLGDTCPQWGMGEDRRISVMYPVGNV